MRDDDHGEAFLREVADGVEDFAHEFRVECGCGFVKEKEIGLNAERPGNGDALLLTAREPAGIFARLFEEPHAL